MINGRTLYNLEEAKELMKVHGCVMERTDYGYPHRLKWSKDRGNFRYMYGEEYAQSEKASGVLYQEGKYYAIVSGGLRGEKPWTE